MRNNGIENSRPPRILNPKLEFGYGRWSSTWKYSSDNDD